MTARRRRLALLLAAALAVTLSGCTGDDPAQEAAPQEISIGLMTPMTGPSGAAGKEAQRGAQLAADVINGLNPSIPLPLAAGSGLPGLGGARLKIVTVDTGYPAPQDRTTVASTAVNRLVTQDRVAALVGAHDAQITELASQRSERYEVPFINADSPATFLTEGGRDWFFRVGPSWRTAGEAFFSLLRRQGDGARKILVLHARDKAGYDVRTTVGELASEGGFAEPQQVGFAPDATNLLDAVDQVRAAQPDTVFMYATPATAQPLIEAFAARQYKPKAMMSFGLGSVSPKSYQQSAPAVSGLCRAVSWSAEPAERNLAARAVAALYQRRFAAPMTESAASSFTAVYTVAMAMDAAKSIEPRRLRTSLLSLDVPGEQTVMPWSGIRFDETHQNVGAQDLVEQFVTASFRVVYPSDSASVAMTWPVAGTT